MDAITANQRLAKQQALVSEAEQLRDSLTAMRPAVANDPDRRYKLNCAIVRSNDRISRRKDHLLRIQKGDKVITTVDVAAWIAKHFTKYAVAGGVDSTEVAGDVCQALDLWDFFGSIPMWVYRISESTCARLEAEAMHRRNFFVEKPINYESNGDVLWA